MKLIEHFLRMLRCFLGSRRYWPVKVQVGDTQLWAPLYLKRSLEDFPIHGEPFTVSLFQRFITPGSVIFDVGANIGVYTIIGAKKTGTFGNVYAFEPDPRNYKFLRRNIKSHHLVNVRAVNKAIANTVGDVTLYIHGDPTSSRIVKSSWRAEGIVGIHRVEVTTIDKFAETYKISNIDVMKMDVEGAELEVIKGAERTLQKLNSAVVFFELAPRLSTKPKIMELLELLNILGFQIWLIDEESKQLLHNALEYIEEDSILGRNKINALALKGITL